jgi:hypothetical protein
LSEKRPWLDEGQGSGCNARGSQEAATAEFGIYIAVDSCTHFLSFGSVSSKPNHGILAGLHIMRNAIGLGEYRSAASGFFFTM